VGATPHIVVLGGGPAGAVAARALALLGLPVSLLEARAGDTFKVGEGLPPAARPLLRRLGLWERFEADGHLPSYGNASAWGTSRLMETDFIRDPNGHGWHLDRARFDGLLREAAREAGAQVRHATRVTGCEPREGGGFRLSLEEGGEVEAAWVVDCTGRTGWLARRQGARRIWEDHLVAFVTRQAPDPRTRDEDSQTVLEATTDGWWYTARLPSRERVVVYLTDPGTDSARRARTPGGFLELLRETEHLRARTLGRGYTPPEAVHAQAAGSSRLAPVWGAGWVAAGDAAASFDPLSSQGILAAMDSGQRVAEALQAHLGGDGEALGRYTQRVDAVYATYLRNRTRYYGMERRFAASDFWKSRTGPVSP
jgi:flavin-dependent dehydrogenase